MNSPTLAERFDDLVQAVAEDAVRSSTPLPSGRGMLDPDAAVRRDVDDFRAELSALSDPPGLSTAQEPKYTVNGAAIVTRANGQPIPADEPVFILRARDVHALQALMYYAVQCGETAHSLAVMDRIDDFKAFAEAHPARMKVPDTATPRVLLAPHPAWPFPTGKKPGGSNAAH